MAGFGFWLGVFLGYTTCWERHCGQFTKMEARRDDKPGAVSLCPCKETTPVHRPGFGTISSKDGGFGPHGAFE